jgi:hypothetical protein
MKTSIRDRRALARLLRTLRALTPRRPRRVFLEEAEIELWGLYRREQAELLRQASTLRNAPRDAGSRRAWLDAWRSWRARAADCAHVCACDGYPLAPRLAATLAHPARHWPSANALRADARRLAGVG